MGTIRKNESRDSTGDPNDKTSTRSPNNSKLGTCP